jgi:hypothetical protein
MLHRRFASRFGCLKALDANGGCRLPIAMIEYVHGCATGSATPRRPIRARVVACTCGGTMVSMPAAKTRRSSRPGKLLSPTIHGITQGWREGLENLPDEHFGLMQAAIQAARKPNQQDTQ